MEDAAFVVVSLEAFAETTFLVAAAVATTTFLAAPAAAPRAATAAVDLLDADCCTAVFFATMAAAPSHIVILHANRAGTINRLQARGNGARRPIRPPPRAARRACMRCAQLPAG
ncbi:hypothetical protein GCM10010252_35690 [Streptomyces aureoverticillatus]|nr:hypothetical protein GCM10010252_35690 [Streptomyces aureoverticillatus]